VNKWNDFLLTVFIRFTCGVFLGCLVSVLFGYRTILKALSEDNIWGVVARLAVWGVVGGIICIFTTPRYTWPWYKSDRE